MKMKYAELLVSLFWLFFAISLYYVSFSFPVSRSYAGVGAGVFPRLLSTIIFVLCVVHITQVFIKKDESHLAIPNLIGIIVNLGILIIYLLCLSYLGYFFIFTPLFLIILLRLLNVLDWRKVITIAFGFDIFAYLIFAKLLGVDLM